MKTDRAGAAAAMALILMMGCSSKAPVVPATEVAKSAADGAKSETEAKEGAAALVLNADQVAKLGLETKPAVDALYTPETEGFGLVLGHEAFAQVVADVATADAAQSQSRLALDRVKSLSGTSGALPIETQENAQHQAAVADAAAALAQHRVTALFGQRPPWSSTHDSLFNALANGEIKLVRVTYPLNGPSGVRPKSLRLTRLDAGPHEAGWRSASVWDAPADPAVPGRSLFTLLRDPNVGEGERLLAWAPTGAAESGVLVPLDAVVVTEGHYACYVEKPSGSFNRITIDTTRPVAGGYVVTKDVAAGDALVVKGAGLLLARGSKSAAEAD